MKIKLTTTPPVEERHKLIIGKVLEVKQIDDNNDVWVQGDGELVKLWKKEYKRIKE